MTNHTEKPQDEAENEMKRTIEEIKQIPYEDLVALYFMAQSEVFDTRSIMQGVRQQAIDLTIELEHIKNSDVIIGEDGCLHLDCSSECQKDKLTFSEPEGELVKVECDNNECIRGANYLKNHKLYHAYRLKSCEVPVVSDEEIYNHFRSIEGSEYFRTEDRRQGAKWMRSLLLPVIAKMVQRIELKDEKISRQEDTIGKLISFQQQLQQDNKQLRDEVIDKLKSLELLSNKFPSLSPVLKLRKEIATLIDKLTNGK